MREQYLGRTPSKNSRTGKEVFDRMMNEETPRAGIKDGAKEFFDSENKQWRSIDEADMGHIEDAVKWWNREGRQYGAKSEEVRQWMLKSKNYELQYYRTNRSKGAKITERYEPPLQ